MRDILEDAQKMLNDNRFMDSHVIISALSNEIVKLRCDNEQLRTENFYLQLERKVKE